MSILGPDLFLLAFLAFGLFCGGIYHLQREDRKILERFPDPPPLTNAKEAILFKELSREVNGFKRMSHEEQRVALPGLIESKQRLQETTAKIERERAAYQRALKGWIKAWRDLDEIYQEAGFFGRVLNPKKAKTLAIFRKEYYSAKHRFQLEEKRLSSPERIWLKEGKHAQQKRREKAKERQLKEASPSAREFLKGYLDPELEPLRLALPQQRPDQLFLQELPIRLPNLSHLTFLDEEFRLPAGIKLDFSAESAPGEGEPQEAASKKAPEDMPEEERDRTEPEASFEEDTEEKPDFEAEALPEALLASDPEPVSLAQLFSLTEALEALESMEEEKQAAAMKAEKNEQKSPDPRQDNPFLKTEGASPSGATAPNATEPSATAPEGEAPGPKLIGVSLKGAQFIGTRFAGPLVLELCDLRGADLAHARMKGDDGPKYLIRCDLSEASLRKGHFKGVTFLQCDLTRANLTQARFEDCRFLGCRFTDARLGEASFQACLRKD